VTLKASTKGEHVLRFEAIVHNTRDLGCGRVLARFGEIITRLNAMLERFCTALDCVDVVFVPGQTVDQLPLGSQIGSTRIGGVDLNKPRILAGRSRRYHAPPEALRAITALLVLRDQVIGPLLAGVRVPRRGRQPATWTRTDPHYETLRRDMKALFDDLGIAASPRVTTTTSCRSGFPSRLVRGWARLTRVGNLSAIQASSHTTTVTAVGAA